MGSELEKIMGEARGSPHRGMTSAQRAEWLLSAIRTHDPDLYTQIPLAIDRLTLAASNELTTAIVAQPQDQLEFAIGSLSDRYRLYNVSYAGSPHTIEWSKEYLDGGKPYTQDQAVQTFCDTQWKVPDLPLHFATFRALHINRKMPDKKQRALVKEMRKMFLANPQGMTSTRVEITKTSEDTGYDIWKYPRERKDTVYHNWGYPRERSVTGYFYKNRELMLLEHAEEDDVKKILDWAINKPGSNTRFGLSANPGAILLSSYSYHGFIRLVRFGKIISGKKCQVRGTIVRPNYF